MRLVRLLIYLLAVLAGLYLLALVVRKRGRFTSRTDRDNAVDASADLRFDQFFEGRKIDIFLSEWRD